MSFEPTPPPEPIGDPPQPAPQPEPSPDPNPSPEAAPPAQDNARLAALELELAREKALRRFPQIDPDLLTAINDPAQVAGFAERLANSLHQQQAAAAAQVPAPVPGTGAAPEPGDIANARIDELMEKGRDGQISSAERRDLYRLGLDRGLKELFAGRRSR